MLTRLEVKRRIDNMIDMGVPFSLIEEYIESLPPPFTNATKAAIWLYTWSQQPQNVRDEIVLVFMF